MKGFEATRIVSSLRQQPRAECRDLGKRRCRLRANDPVRFGHSQGNVDRPYKTTVNEIPSRKGGARKRNALAIDGSVDQHARTVQNRTATYRIGDPGGVKPPRPCLPIVEAKQRKFQQIRCLGYAVASRNELRTANRKKLLGAKAYDIEPGPVAVAMPDREVNVFTREVDVMQRARSVAGDGEASFDFHKNNY
jgi:hypothetical protein